MKKISLKLLPLLLLLIAISCTSDDDKIICTGPEEIPCGKQEAYLSFRASMEKCSGENAPDSTVLQNGLIGIWELKYTACAWGQSVTCVSPNQTSVEFKVDNTLEVIKDGVITDTASWKVRAGNQVISLDLSPAVNPLLEGIVFFCDDLLEFNLSHADLCDHLFKRKP